MVFKNPFQNISTGSLFIFVIVLIILIQVVSLLISAFIDIPALKTGSWFIFLSGGLSLIFLAKVVFRGNFEKLDVVGFLLILGLTVILYMYLPDFFPEIFSFLANSPAGQSADSLQSILNLP